MSEFQSMRLPLGDEMTVDKESFFKAALYVLFCLLCLVFPILLKFYGSCRTSLTVRILMYVFGKER